MNNLSYHLSSGVKQFADGETFHWRIEITRGIRNNCDMWFITITVNDYTHSYTRHAGWGAWQHHLYCRGIDNAVVSAQMMIDRRITNQRMAIDQPMFVRMQRIIDTIRYDAVLQKLANGVYPDVLNDRITIQCADVYQDAIADAIAGLTDGISIVWKTYTVQPFTGLIADTQERIAS